MKLEGSELIIGGAPLEDCQIPACYGSWLPTAIKVPLHHYKNPESRELLTTELFGPFQIVTEYDDSTFPTVMEILNKLPNFLTAACVSNDPIFTNEVMANTVNGTTYHGMRARTTGAPQNHWFGPSGDSRGAGIGTPYAIRYTWSHHREIIQDFGPVPEGWTMPPPA